MITFKDFLDEFNNQSVDYDGVYGSQCFDLIQEWNVDWLNNPFIPGAYAYQIYNNYNPQKYTRIANGPNDVPKEGDIVVWSWYYNYAGGHTGIATGKGDVWSFECFEQNDPTGTVSHLKTYKYDYVLGWIRAKNYNPTPPPILTKEQQMLKIINTPISDPDFRNKVRTIYGV